MNCIIKFVSQISQKIFSSQICVFLFSFSCVVQEIMKHVTSNWLLNLKDVKKATCNNIIMNFSLRIVTMAFSTITGEIWRAGACIVPFCIRANRIFGTPIIFFPIYTFVRICILKSIKRQIFIY